MPGDRVVVAIHQPNFFPWLGYFDKLARSDVFVMLDSVQYPKGAGTYMNRSRILSGGVARWLTAPIVRAVHGLRRVDEVDFTDEPVWRSRALAQLDQAYRDAAHWAEVRPMIDEQLRRPDRRLADFNVGSVAVVCDALGLAPTVVRSSHLDVGPVHATQLLIAIVRAVGGTTYLCGGGAGGYQDDAAFAPAGVELEYQSFRPAPYDQVGGHPFVGGLSVIDALANLGVAGTAKALAPA